MGEPKEEDLYRNFSRKDLQGLCKKYGLPARKSNSEMATSLILYLEKNLCSRAIWEGTRSDSFASEMTKLQAGMKMNSTDNQRKDCGRIASHSSLGNYRRRNHRVTEQNDMQKCKGSASSDKASQDIGHLTQLQIESNSGIAIQENTFSSVVSSSTISPSPTFAYEVSCEDGIQLFIDLNSSASDWIENLKSGIHVCNHLQTPISQSFHQDIALINCSKENSKSVVMDPSKDADDGPLDNHAQTDENDGLKALIDTLDGLDNSKEHQPILSLKLDSGTKGKLPAIASSRSEETLTGMNCDFKGKSVLSDPQCSGFPVDQGPNTGNGTICENASTFTELQTLSVGFDNSPSRVHEGVDLTKQPTNGEVVKFVQSCPVQEVDKSKFAFSSPLVSSCSLDGLDIRSRGVTSFFGKSDRPSEKDHTHSAGSGTDKELHSCCSGGPFDLAIPVQNDGDRCNLSKLNGDDTSGVPSEAHLRKLHTRDPGKGTGRLKCLKYKDEPSVPHKKLTSSESNVKLKRKKHGNGIEGQSKFVKSEGKILRSSKQFVGDGHSKRRRSSRLFIK